MTSRGSEAPRPWIGVVFNCCRIYQRIYRNRQGTAYVGWCPRCTARISVRIGPGGIQTRFFQADSDREGR